MKITDYHAKYYAYELTKRCSSDSLEKLTGSLVDAQVDLNPHQIEAALFAFRSPLSNGAILADEVGLGKTIEAGIILSQKWAEQKRKILIISPANLRKQWSQELLEKFFLPSILMDGKLFKQTLNNGKRNPFERDEIIICSYNFVANKGDYIKLIDWDLVVVDEAHKLRNVYKTSSKMAKDIKDAINHSPKILLTATPLQNSLLELYGLVSIIDKYTFGDLKSYKSQFARLSNESSFSDLKERLKPICNRTLRKQVLEYIKYTNRIPITQEFFPYENEHDLYEKVSNYLRREKSFALPNSQRQLITLIIRKLLASSTFAVAKTLQSLIIRLESIIESYKINGSGAGITDDYDDIDDLPEEWNGNENNKDLVDEVKVITEEDIKHIKEEIEELKEYLFLAKSIDRNAKGDALTPALELGFKKARELGANEKAIIFTESVRTQSYLYLILNKGRHEGKIVLFNGSNNDEKSKEIYSDWLEKYQGTDRVTGVKSADIRLALVDYFREHASIMIATEAAAEGLNLQFCSLVVNYDLPWNPQRIEQRIGRCHRYGQKHDVVVINFLNRKNEADQRVYELLAQKFKLFDGVFGSSDEVLGSLESGVDFEKRIMQIYQECRTKEEIEQSFNKLQDDLKDKIDSKLKNTRQKLLENFDQEVAEKLKVNLKQSQQYLNKYEEWLWFLANHALKNNAQFNKENYSFLLESNPYPKIDVVSGKYKLGKYINDAHIFRLGHPLAQGIIEDFKKKELGNAEIIFNYTNSISKISLLKKLVGRSGYLSVSLLTIDSFEVLDYLVFSGITDDGDILEEEQICRMLTLGGDVSREDVNIEVKQQIEELEQKRKNKILYKINKKNSLVFEDEMEKLDKWADDKRNSLKVNLKELDEELKELRKQSRLASNLPEKLRKQKKIRKLEDKRDKAWREFDEATKDIGRNKDNLIDKIEKKMRKRITLNNLFTIKWKII